MNINYNIYKELNEILYSDFFFSVSVNLTISSFMRLFLLFDFKRG